MEMREALRLFHVLIRLVGGNLEFAPRRRRFPAHRRRRALGFGLG